MYVFKTVNKQIGLSQMAVIFLDDIFKSVSLNEIFRIVKSISLNFLKVV